ncbi:hypothetical protein C8R32_101213 [Nitrosospira sp. Nsp5]|uniref:Uncharacterized protein n=1 Tax=Nitrosospira multiformis TaxID=1231 RepID=A0ABY0TG31_9PROT|nr:MULTISPECIES: hypothetical protein [Nitrosospira]PTR10683.1 hypothetical protein C8R32_101213 [Nitrosospira sp. Nsp5]SDQ77804.1 hypothetical protein SAMN05216402_2248 [Nitrosospira multiformis]
MGALIFYIAIYFIGYYAAHFLNQMVGRVLIRNRRIAGLILVFTVSIGHGYKIMSTPPPHDHDDGAGYAMGLYVIMPVTIIVIAVLYLMWREGNDDDVS